MSDASTATVHCHVSSSDAAVPCQCERRKPCHGSTFDLAGRVYRNKPAPTNLEVPPHRFLGDTKLVIGEDSTA